MIQAQKDGKAKEQKSEEQVTCVAPPRTVATAAVRTVHVDPRRYVTNTLGTPTTVILSDGSTLPESGAYQYHRVTQGALLQHVVTPVQVAGNNSTVASESSLPVSSRCVVTSSQDLAHILVAVTTASTLHSVDRQPAAVNVSAGTSPQAIGTIANVVTSNQRAPSGTILAHSVPQNSLPQRIVLNSSNMSDVFVRLSSSTGTSGSSPQFMVLESPAGLVPSGDVTKVHSYSLASAAVSALSSGGGMQKVVISNTGQHLQSAGISHKAILTPAHPLRTATKRLSSAPASRLESSSSVNSASDIVSRLNIVNKLLSGLIVSEGKILNIPSSPKAKKIKLDKVVVNKDIGKRKKVVDHIAKKMRLMQHKCYNQQAEYFFLKNNGNIMDYIVWKKKFPTELLEYLRANRFDPYDDIKNITDCLSKGFGVSNSAPGYSGEQLQSSKVSSNSSSHLQSSSIRGFTSPSRSTDSSSSASKSNRQSVLSQKQLAKQNSISSVYDSQIGSQEEIVERAKQEAYVMQRVGDLRKEGLWSLKRLPKVSEAPRIKAHWDYLLEEMVWLATDFAQERKWKKAAAKKCARMITKYFQEKEIKAEKAEKEEQARMRKIASSIAREVKQFWNNIEKLVEYKQQTWLEEKRKKVLDTHLNFIVDQTEKYSSWLTQGMNRSSINGSPDSSRPSSPLHSSSAGRGDGSSDFEPENSESDDEETIKKEEEDLDVNEQNEEIKLLQQESEMSLEDFLESLPPEIRISASSSSETLDSKVKDEDGCDAEVNEKEDETDKNDADNDDDYKVSGDEEDDEQTILEQEMMEVDVDHRKEIQELEAES